MMVFFTFILMSWVVARVARFIANDTLWEGTRDKLLEWLRDPIKSQDDDGTVTARGSRVMFVREKAAELIECVYCNSMWVSAGAVLGVLWFTDASMPLPLFWWPALSMAAIAIVEWTDGTREIILKQDQSK